MSNYVLGVKAEIAIPGLKMHASMIMRKNFDASLPASHTIDLRLTFDPGSPIKGVKDIALPLMRRDDPPAADALTGVRVKISENYFLIGLNRADADVARNTQLIAERGWFDFPIQLDDDRIAKLTFEKGHDGDRIIADAIAKWNASGSAGFPDTVVRESNTPRSRAVMSVSTVADADKRVLSVGKAVWSIVPAPSGQPTGIGVKAEIDIPDLKMHALMIMRKNFIAGLPLSHIIDFHLTFDAGSPINGVADVKTLQMRDDDPTVADTLTGVRAKISDDHFLIGLIRGEDDETLNRKVITTRSWFNLPMRLDDGRFAKLAIEKGADGNRVIWDAITAWGWKGINGPSDPFVSAIGKNSSSYARSRNEIALLRVGRAFKVHVVINGRMETDALVDSGATYVSIPADVISKLKLTGTLTDNDFTGTEAFLLADGSIVPAQTFRLQSLKVGNRVVENVIANSARPGAPFLLGLSFLTKFKSWSIDNDRGVLVLEGDADEKAGEADSQHD